MKTNHLPSVCIVQSVTYTAGRRLMTFTNAAPQPATSKRRKPAFKLKVMAAPQTTGSFKPVIQVRSHTKA